MMALFETTFFYWEPGKFDGNRSVHFLHFHDDSLETFCNESVVISLKTVIRIDNLFNSSFLNNFVSLIENKMNYETFSLMTNGT